MRKIPEFKPGDLIRVYTKIIEGDKIRIAPFQGVVIGMKGNGISKTFTVRKISAGIGVERIFPFNSPMITKIEVKKRGKVRRTKLTYLRQRRAKKIKVEESAIPKPELDSSAGISAPENLMEGKSEGTAGHNPVEKI